jgi:hypothetical protein
MPNEFKIKNGLIVDQGGANISGSSFISGSLAINASGSNVFTVDGTAGRLFSVDDSLSGSLFSVNTAAGLPVIEAFSDNTIRVGQYGKQALFVSQSRVGIGKESALNGILDVSGSVTITGSVTATNFTGSLSGTASWANNAITSSYALTASFALNAGGASIDTGSFATTGSNVFRGNQVVTGSLTLSSSAEIELTVIGNQINTGSITATQGFTGSLFGTASWANNAVTASHALNGGVTQLLAGPNVTLSPTNGLGQVTVSSTSGGGGFNTATGSYGSFYDTTTQTNLVANIPRSMSLNTTDITNGVSISGSVSPFNTYIKTENAGVYNIQFSAQLDKTDSGADEVVIWLRKNGINLTDTATTITLIGNNGKQVAAWNWFVNSAANDYYQIIWQSADTAVRLFAEPLDGHPGIPSVIVTANRVDQFLSNTGSFSGSFNGSLFGTASWANNATTASYILNAVSSSFAATASSADNFTVRGTLTAQTIIAQTITSSTDFVTGSTRFGSLSTNTHQFTGSVSITGSLAINGNVGIGTTSPSEKLEVSGSGKFNSTQIIGPDGTYGTTYPMVSFTGTANGSHRIFAGTSDDMYFAAATSRGFEFRPNGGILSALNILSGGNVGIGITSPEEKLHVSGNIKADGRVFINAGNGNQLYLNNAGQRYTQITFDNNSTGTSQAYLAWDNTDSFFEMYAKTGGGLKFYTNATETMRITSGGNVGIGTTNPSYKLDVNMSSLGTIAQFISNDGTYNPRLLINGTADGLQLFATYSTLAGALMLGTGGVERMRITGGGDVGIGTTSPNAKLDVSGSAIISGSLSVTQGITGSLFGTSSFSTSSSFATTSSFASNGGVTQIIAGTNVTISPTNGLGAVTINSSGGGGAAFPYTGSAIITGSLNVTGSVNITGSLLLNGSPVVTGQIVLTAGGGWPSITSGSNAPILTETATNRVNFYYIGFPDTIQTFANWSMPMPSDYNGGTITAVFYWAAGTASTNSVEWGLAARAFADGDVLDSAFGTPQEVADANQANDDVNISAATPAITIGGTPAAGNFVQFRAYRNPGDANDNLAATAELLSIRITYTRA